MARALRSSCFLTTVSLLLLAVVQCPLIHAGLQEETLMRKLRVVWSLCRELTESRSLQSWAAQEKTCMVFGFTIQIFYNFFFSCLHLDFLQSTGLSIWIWKLNVGKLKSSQRKYIHLIIMIKVTYGTYFMTLIFCQKCLNTMKSWEVLEAMKIGHILQNHYKHR